MKWIKSLGTALGNSERKPIFVPADKAAALEEALGTSGDGSSRTTGIAPEATLWPSIETTFYAALDSRC